MDRLKELRFVWLLMAAATVGFIWLQSTLSTAESAATSDAVGEVVIPLVGGPTSPVGSFLDRFLRKIAHFSEFALLGAEGEMFLFGRHTVRRTALLATAGLAVGALDETLQIVTGRGAAVIDVLIDFSGFLFGVGLAFALAKAAILIYNKRKANAPCGVTNDNA